MDTATTLLGKIRSLIPEKSSVNLVGKRILIQDYHTTIYIINDIYLLEYVTPEKTIRRNYGTDDNSMMDYIKIIVKSVDRYNESGKINSNTIMLCKNYNTIWNLVCQLIGNESNNTIPIMSIEDLLTMQEKHISILEDAIKYKPESKEVKELENDFNKLKDSTHS
jgi:hypothetical protein